MNRRLIHFSAVALRWLAIALLLAIPVGSGIAYAVGWAKGHYVQVFGWSLETETSAGCAVESGAISFDYYDQWEGTPPIGGKLFNLPGLRVDRELVPASGRKHGDAMLDIDMRWWFLLLANIPPLLLSIRLAWPMLRRRVVPGRCHVCGYDLRATPDRCPECGHVPASQRLTAPHPC